MSRSTAAALAWVRRASGGTSWSLRQMRSGRAYRVICLYNWSIGIGCGLVVLCARLIGARLPIMFRSAEVGFGALKLLDNYIRDLVVANLVLVGAIIIRGPWTTGVLQVLRDLAQRHTGMGAESVGPHYRDGALLTLRAALIAPAIMLCMLLPAEHDAQRFIRLAVSISLMLVAIAGFGAIAGLTAVRIRRSVRRYAIAAWLCLWIVPELVRVVVPHVPTPRSIVGDVLTNISLDRGSI